MEPIAEEEKSKLACQRKKKEMENIKKILENMKNTGSLKL